MGCFSSKSATSKDVGPVVLPARSSLKKSTQVQSATGRAGVKFVPGTDEEKPSAPTPLEQVEDIGDRLTKLGTKAAKGGGFSEVWEGMMKTDSGERRVAIKCLRATDVENMPTGSPQVRDRLDKRMKRELRVWMPVSYHPRILDCLGFATIDGMPALVSPWCKNGNAQEYLSANPDCDRNALITQVAEGLYYLHGLESPIVHYDVKLANVMIDDNGEALLTDFGVAKVVDEYRTGLTTSGKAMTTLVYSSPEAIDGEPRSIESDVYSFACLALEVKTGRVPWYFLTTNVSILKAKGNSELPDPKDFPELPKSDPLWSLLYRCWEHDPAKRPTMEQVLEELQHMPGYRTSK